MLPAFLPSSFVHATLTAFELPRHLADRYAAPDPVRPPSERRSAPALRERSVRRGRTPAWPFPRV
jgi:hypothetical protein